MDQSPIAASALRVLLSLGGIIQGELDIVESTELIICEHGRAVAIRSDSELHWQSTEIGQNLAELRVHTVLTRSQIYRTDREPFHHSSYLLEAKPVRPRRIAVT